MIWMKPGIAWVKLHNDPQWTIAATVEKNEEEFLELSRLSGLIREGNYDKKTLDAALKQAYNRHGL